MGKFPLDVHFTHRKRDLKRTEQTDPLSLKSVVLKLRLRLLLQRFPIIDTIHMFITKEL